jgi:molybdopterin-containing oxidoreductase family iron-sulfur binding subunit
MDIPPDPATGRHFWRSLEERLDSPEVRAHLHQHYPDDAEAVLNPLTRRRFLALLGASMGLAGLAGCSTRAPNEPIMPYVRQPEELVPGKAMYFATAMPLSGWAVPLLVESHEGRPTKVEGNPTHPINQLPDEEPFGPTDVFAQASVLTLYDPDRSQTVTYRDQVRNWDQAQVMLQQQYAKLKEKDGEGLWVLTEAVNSPTLMAQLSQLSRQLKKARHVAFEPGRRDGDLQGLQAFGEVGWPEYRFNKARVILALDADFLTQGPNRLRAACDFMSRRRSEKGEVQDMNRLYAVEATPSSTGLVADHRLALKPSQIEQFARLLARELGVEGVPETPALPGTERWVKEVAADLRRNSGSALVLAGEAQPPTVHALAWAIQKKLDSPAVVESGDRGGVSLAVHGLAGFTELVRAMDAGAVEALIILGGNPVYTSPRVSVGEERAVRFGDCLDKVPLRIHLGLFHDETAQRCHWHIPKAHYLESWGNAVTAEGHTGIIQPLIAPLYRGKTAIELLSALLDAIPQGGYDLVRAWWSGSESDWRKALHNGVTNETHIFRLPPDRETQSSWYKHDAVKWSDFKKDDDKTYEIVFRLDPTVHDGRFANNGWLQELPKPVTLLTWDNAILVSPKTAKELGVKVEEGPHGGSHGEMITDLVELEYRGVKVKAALWPVPGHADGCVTVHFGYGRTRAGKVGNGAGFDFYPLWHADAPFYGTGATLKRTGERYTLACTQGHFTMDASEQARERGIIRAGTWDPKTKTVAFADGHGKEKDTPFDEHLDVGYLPGDNSDANKKRLALNLYDNKEAEYRGHRWGMSIDMGACIGCGACVVACQAENNIPVVGKDQVNRGREMHWIRVDRYFAGTDENVPERAYFQPLPCMHCEKAPCEVVCPVQATVHSADGINEMVYNRCVGTRYCSNNCPYKVRRFNFLQFADYTTGSLKLLRNPDVTVRSRGVMEKCTFCVQRIRAAEITARNDDNRPIADGEIVTACQAVCPARAISFGDINDPKSRVGRRKAEPLHYGLLLELNTRPRVSYLAAVRNPNPALEGPAHGH